MLHRYGLLRRRPGLLLNRARPWPAGPIDRQAPFPTPNQLRTKHENTAEVKNIFPVAVIAQLARGAVTVYSTGTRPGTALNAESVAALVEFS